jgi:Putative zinc-finger
MSVTGADGRTCRYIRQLLGVYVVGAIDPAERSLVDEHLPECPACRDELAGLAGLPAMLGRIPVQDAERIVAGGVPLPDAEELPPDMLNSLLKKVWLRRRARTWRVAAAVAAAAVIAAGSAAAAVELAAPSYQVATGTSPSTHAAAVVDYSSVPWGSAMRVQVTGIPAGTTCEFWVLSKSGRKLAGSWTVSESSYGSKHWYSASSSVAAGSVHGFEITAAGKTLLWIPAG